MVRTIKILLIVSSIIVLIGCNTTTPKPIKTGWVYDNSINYTGKYRHIAEDNYLTNYPVLNVGKTVDTEFGEIKIPLQWNLLENRIINKNGLSIINITEEGFYLSEPYFGAMPIHSEPISWARLSDKGSYRVYSLVLEKDEGTAADVNDAVSINRMVIFISDEKGYFKEKEFYYGFILDFKKARVYEEIEYFISNKTIDEMINSFNPTE